MAENNIPLNLRRLRQAKDFTQECLAAKSGISRLAYRNIETGISEPRVTTLQSIADALDVSIRQLVEPVRELRTIRFRSKKAMRSREQVLADTGRWLADFCSIEDALNDRQEYKFDGIQKRLADCRNRGEESAALARKALGLNPKEPVRDICGLLESGGIKVGEQKIASHHFFGLSAAVSDGGPAVVVNTWGRISVERWIFTAAHELGHLILHLSDYDVSCDEEDEVHEEEANAFAAAFLMPDASFRKEWDATCGLAFVDRVLKVKRIFRVSYRTVLYRLANSCRGTGNIWARFQMDYKRRNRRTLLRNAEPDALAQDAFRASFPEDRSAGEPDRLSRADFVQGRLAGLVRRAVEQEKISLGRGAEVLGISLLEMRELALNWIG